MGLQARTHRRKFLAGCSFVNFRAKNSQEATYWGAFLLLVACCSLTGARDRAAGANSPSQIFDPVQLALVNFWAQNSQGASYCGAFAFLVVCCSLIGALDRAAGPNSPSQIFDQVQLGEFLGPKQPGSQLPQGLSAPCCLLLINRGPGWGCRCELTVANF